MLFSFIGGRAGAWQVTAMTTPHGSALAPVAALAIVPGDAASPSPGGWHLRGVVSNLRYTTRPEMIDLDTRSPGLGRSAARCAAMIALRKTAA